MNYDKLVAALRICADDSTGCGECPFVEKCVHAYYMDLKLAAADAIEILQERLKEYFARIVWLEKEQQERQEDTDGKQ